MVKLKWIFFCVVSFAVILSCKKDCAEYDVHLRSIDDRKSLIQDLISQRDTTTLAQNGALQKEIFMETLSFKSDISLAKSIYKKDPSCRQFSDLVAILYENFDLIKNLHSEESLELQEIKRELSDLKGKL